MRKTDARYSGRYHYGVELHDFSSTSYHINIASQLIVEKFAKLSSEKLEVKHIDINIQSISGCPYYKNAVGTSKCQNGGTITMST